MTTLYDTLSVPENATAEEIKRAYRKAVMRWHPDRNVGQEHVARAAFLDIRNAYAILSDPAQRQVYDSVFAEEMKRQEASGCVRNRSRLNARPRCAPRRKRNMPAASRWRCASRRRAITATSSAACCWPTIATTNLRAVSPIAPLRCMRPGSPRLHRRNLKRRCLPRSRSRYAHGTQQEEDPAPADRVRSFSDIWMPFWNVLRS